MKRGAVNIRLPTGTVRHAQVPYNSTSLMGAWTRQRCVATECQQHIPIGYTWNSFRLPCSPSNGAVYLA